MCRRAPLFVITTDGMENASRRYTAPQVKECIPAPEGAVRLGVPLPGGPTSTRWRRRGHLGIAPDRAVNYHSDSVGTRLNYAAMSQAVSSLRNSPVLDPHWKDAVEADFRGRRSKQK